MSILKKKTVYTKDNTVNFEKGISVRNVLQLLDQSFYKQYYESLELDTIIDDFISIKGAKILVDEVLGMESKVQKYDVLTSTNNIILVDVVDDIKACIEVTNLNDENEKHLGITTYSAKSDILDKLYEVDKFTNFCRKQGYGELIESMFVDLEEYNRDNKTEHVLRFAKLRKTEVNFIRAIVSPKYGDYNIKFSVFITLISLHKLMKTNSESVFSIQNFVISDSEIRVNIQKEGYVDLVTGSKVSFGLQLVNDEVKREAVKLRGIFTIEFEKFSDHGLVIQSQNESDIIIKIPHKKGINVISKLSNLDERINDFEKSMRRNIEVIKSIEKPNDVRDFLHGQISRAKSSDFLLIYKEDAKRILLNKVDSILQLLESFHKIDHLIKEEDVKAKDYIRQKLYNVLLGRRTYK